MTEPLSDWVLVAGDGQVAVHRQKDGGGVSLTLLRPGPRLSLYMTEAEAVKSAEFLGRATVPGQVPPATGETPPTKDEIDRCGYSEDPDHRCRVCYDYAAGDYRPARITEARDA